MEADKRSVQPDVDPEAFRYLPSPTTTSLQLPARSSSNLRSRSAGFIEGEDRVRRLKRSRWHVLDFLLGTRQGQCLGLLLLFVVLIVAGAVCWRAIGGLEDMYDDTWHQSFWFSWGMFFDPGTQMGFPPESAVKFKVVAMAFSVFGFTFNLLILGLIVEMAREALNTLHKRRNRIVESGHSLVLGWSEKTLFMLREMMAAARNRGQVGRIVILAEEDVGTMWAEIRRHFPRLEDRRHFICRRGSPYECDDLAKASAKSARDVVILGAKQRARESDLDAIRCVMALAALPEPPSGAVITEVRSPESSCVVSSILEGAEGTLARDPVNRVLALMALDPIVGDCFVSLVSFIHGEELYCKKLRELPPEVRRCRTFGEASRALKVGICVGLNPPDALTVLAPDDDAEIGPEDKLVVMAHSEAELKGLTSFAEKFMRRDLDDTNTLLTRNVSSSGGERKLVIVGWTLEMIERLLILDEYAPKGTEVHMLNQLTEKERRVRMEATVPGAVLENLELVHHVGSTTSLRKLALLPLKEAAAVLVLADLGDPDAAESDAACLGCAVTVDRLCRGEEKRYGDCTSRARVICEVLDPRTERVLSKGGELARAAQFLHSNALETGIFAMASNDPAVFNCLLMLLHPNEPGHIAARPLERYLRREDGRKVDPALFWDLWEAARGKDEVLLGWHLTAKNQTVLNPDKSLPTGLTAADKLVVLQKRATEEPCASSHFGQEVRDSEPEGVLGILDRWRWPWISTKTEVANL